MRRNVSRPGSLIALAVLAAWGRPVMSMGPDGAAVVEEVWSIVNAEFYDPDFNGADWLALKEPYVERAAGVTDHDVLAEIINDLLARLGTSHTHYYAPTTTAYYGLLDIFNQGDFGEDVKRIFPDGVVRYCGIGIVTTAIDGAIFVKDVLEGSPAAETGLKIGDRLIAVDGENFHPISSFRGKAGRDVTILAQRTRDTDRRLEVVVVPEMIQPGELYLESVRRSARIFERDGKKLGFIKLRSYAGEHYHDLVKEIILFGDLADTEGLVLDLRDGWGGASGEYLNLFNRDVPVMEHITRGGERRTFDPQWRKPVVLLVDEGSRSGKEVFAYGFRKFGYGTVVGTRTAGAVVGGRPFLLGNGAVLYLAVVDVRVDGERLEGVGVEPDVIVNFSLPYAAGADPQRVRALEVLAQETGSDEP